MAVLPIGMGSSEAGGYQIERSLRFNSADSANLSRTFSTSGTNLKIRTLSFWLKKVVTGTQSTLLQSWNASSSYSTGLEITSSDQLYLGFGGAAANNITTTAVFRDVSAWYHVVVAIDTTQATASDRVKFYINGSQVTAFSATNYPSQNADSQWMSPNGNNKIGSAWNNSQYSNAYLTEINFIDGQALTPSSFGETDGDTGVWKPKAYSGSYGTNGFYLNFSDNSGTTSTTLGKDSSGNGNNWTPNNFSVTAGAGNDSLVDTPTPYGTDAGAGGEVRGNYATMNPLSNTTGALSNGNLQLNGTSSVDVRCNSTMAVSSGKWYFETTLTTAGSFTSIGIGQGSITNQYPGKDALSYVYTLEQAYTKNNDADTSYGSALTSGDVFMCAFDLDNNKVFFGKNGTWFNSSNPATGTSPAYSITAGTYGAIARPYSSGAVTDWNFGQRPFAYTAPSGFKALVTTNLPDPTVVQGDDYFNTVLWTGDGTSSRAITGVGFQPDWVWDKMRSGAYQHAIVDSVRGGNKVLHSNSTSAEDVDWQYGYVSSFDSDGFTIQAGSTSAENWNLNGSTFVAWCWNAGGSTVTNTAGTISAQVRANPTAGVSIVTYTGTGSAATVGHGLGVAPSMIIIKSRNNAYNWAVWHTSLGGGDNALWLNSTAAVTSAYDYWNGNPTSSVFTLGTDAGSNGSGSNNVAYCFAAVPGFSAFGSYTGNGSADGPFVYTGFRPAFVMIKQSSASGNNWAIVDDKRDDYNVADLRLFPNASDAESSSYVVADLLSNGFKVRGSLGSTNASSATYIYIAFAENPFKYSLAR